MDELVLVQVIQPLRDARSDLDAALRADASVTPHLQPQRVRPIGLHIDLTPALQIIPQLHHVVIKARVRIAPHLQNRHQALVAAADRLVAFDRLKLALERIRPVIILPPHHLHRAQRARHTARHPNLSKGPAPDETQRLMVTDVRRSARGTRHGRPCSRFHVQSSRFKLRN